MAKQQAFDDKVKKRGAGADMISVKVIVASKTQIETNDTLGLLLSHCADDFQCEFFFQTDQHSAASHTVN